MKKTLITLMALAGMASAAEMTDGLAAWWTFDNNSSSYVSYTGATAGVSTGLTEAHFSATGGVDGKGYISSIVNDTRFDFWSDLTAFNISSSSFTLSFKVRGVTADYRDILHFAIDGIDGSLRLQTENPGNGNDVCLYGTNLEVTEDAARDAIRGDEGWANVIIVGNGTSITLNINGYTSTVSYTPAENGIIRNFQLGACWAGIDTDRRVTADYDDLAIWNRALSDTEVKLLASGAVADGTLSIPEPTTATLSLLALAGLAARRRRK